MSRTIHKKELSELVAQRAGTDVETAADSIKALELIIESQLRENKVVAISKFGKFYLKLRERPCINLLTKEHIGYRLERLITFTPRNNMVKVHG